MLINFEQKLRFNDLSTQVTDDLVESVKSTIKEDKEAMEIIKESAKENFEQDKEFTKRTLKDYINDLIEEKAQDAVDRIRIYCEFDLEVKL